MLLLYKFIISQACVCVKMHFACQNWVKSRGVHGHPIEHGHGLVLSMVMVSL